ncbi:MAG: GTPase, partial [Crenarchaeota archaeon]|nr:GTPase [Thermoproteota archaeon]
MAQRKRVVILGAGGRDFHVFNTVFRDNPSYTVVAFTAAQIPGIEWRRYPPSLAGHRYPDGIPIVPEELLEKIIAEEAVDEAVLAYSDLTYMEAGHLVSRVLAAGASLRIVGPRETMLRSILPVAAVTATKTGSGKSTLSRALAREAQQRGLASVVVRHPMAYGDLEARKLIVVQAPEELDNYPLTLEEREEFEPYLDLGVPVLAGIDYGLVLREAERLGDLLIWDGGNNDLPFIRPDLWIVVADATRPETVDTTFPGEANVRLAEIAVITKASTAGRERVEETRRRLLRVNPRLEIAVADLEVKVDRPELVEGKKVVVVEDAPTVTHGGAATAAGYEAARRLGAEVVDPRPYAVGAIKEAYEKHPHMGPVVPSLGYTEKQLRDLQETLNRV